MAERSRSRSRSPLWSRSDSNDTWILEPSDSNISIKHEEVPRELKQQRLLIFKNVPFSWEKSHITDYIKKYCDSSNKEIARSIQDIVVEKDLQNSIITLCLVKFATPDMGQDAKILLENVKDKYEGKKVSVCFNKGTTRKQLESASASGSETKKVQNEANKPSPIPNEVKMETDEINEVPNNFMKIKIKTVQSLNENIEKPNETTDINPLCEQASNRLLPEQFKPKPSLNVLSIRNIPVSWNENKVIEFIKTHTDKTDKVIGDSIEAIKIKRDQNNAIMSCLVQFATFEMCQNAKFILAHVSEKFDGNKIYVVDYRTKFDIRNGSSTDSQNNDLVDPIESVKEVLENSYGDPWILKLKNVPQKWEKLEVAKYIKEFTSHIDKQVGESLEDIYIGNDKAYGVIGTCLVKFSSPEMAKKAFTVLSKVKIKQINNKKINVFLDKTVFMGEVFDLMAKQETNKTQLSNNGDQGSSTTDTPSNTLLLNGIRSDWHVKNVANYIKRNTCMNKDIAANLEGITIQKFTACPNKNYASVKFKNAQSAQAAKFLLSKCTEKKSKRIVITYIKSVPETKKVTIETPQPATPVPTEITQTITEKTQVTTEKSQGENRTLCLRDIPKSWTTFNITKFLEKYTNSNITKAIQYIHLHTVKGKFSGLCIVRFATVTFAELANNQLKTVTDLFEGNKIHSEFDNTNLVIWTSDNRPNMAEMNMRDLKPSVVTDNNYISQVSRNPCTNATNSSAITKNSSAVTTNSSTVTTNSSAVTTNSSAVTTTSSAVTRNPSTNTIASTNANKGAQSNINVFTPDPTAWHVEPKVQPGSYGLSTQFLNGLGLKLPLQNKVFVENLHSEHFCDEEQIYKLFSVAGTVVSVQNFDKNAGATLQAKVEFEHPVEAVQAISMFNNQTVHDLKLLVTMDKKPFAQYRVLPNGVTTLGPGLGKKGLPLTDIKHKIEFHNFKKGIRDELTRIKSDLREIKALVQQNSAQAISQNQDMDTSDPMNPTNSMNRPVSPSTLNDPLLALRNLFNPQVLQMLQTLMQQSMASTSNMQSGYTSGPNVQMCLNGGTNVQLAQNIQGGQNAHSEHVMYNGPYLHGESIMQGHMQSGQIMNGEPNCHVPAIHSGQHYHGFLNTQNGSIVPNSMTMHCGTNLPSSPMMHSNPNVQSGSISPEIQAGPSTTPRSERGQSSGRSGLLSSSKLDNIVDRKHKSVLFNHLPPTVNLKALKIKMREFGDIQMAALSGPGRAVVVFNSPRDAAACVRRLDGTRVDGQTIDVSSL